MTNDSSESHTKKPGRPIKKDKQPLATMTIKIPVDSRNNLISWLDSKGLVFTKWLRVIIKKETGIDL